MKLYEAPEFTKIEFFTEDVLENSIIDPGDTGGSVEIGKLPLVDLGN